LHLPWFPKHLAAVAVQLHAAVVVRVRAVAVQVQAAVVVRVRAAAVQVHAAVVHAVLAVVPGNHILHRQQH
jgi:hypothetical protein